MNENYNGWTNYATWRVNLELFDGIELDAGQFDSVGSLADYLAEMAEEAVTQYGELDASTLAVSYALAFVNNVNFYEIARHFVEDNPAIIAAA